jgi:hypothetical protein
MTRGNKNVAIKRLEEWLTVEGRAVPNDSPKAQKGERKGQEQKKRRNKKKTQDKKGKQLLEEKILNLLEKKGTLPKMAICRNVQPKEKKSLCSWCPYFANERKRKQGRVKECTCEITYPIVDEAIKGLVQKRKVIIIQAPWRDNWQHRRYDIMSGVMPWNGRILEHGGQEGVIKEMLGLAGQTKLQRYKLFTGQCQSCGEEGELQKSYYEPLYICSGCMALEGHAFDNEDEGWEAINGYEYDQQGQN